MNADFHLEIASAASNLSERMQIVNAQGVRNLDELPDIQLNAFDMWKIDQLASKLAGQSLKESLRTGMPNKSTSESLVNLLRAHRLFELNLHSLEDEEKHYLTDLHCAWLPTYQRALQAFNPTARTTPAAKWQAAEVYYGKCAIVCEPFLALLHRELSPVCSEANAALGLPMFGPQLIEDMQNHLLKRFELALAWAVETDANVYCTSYGIDKARATEDDYIGYLDATFSDNEAYHRFYLRFPVLGRWLAQVTRFLSDNGRALIERLRTDIEEISAAFFGKKIVSIRSLLPGRSDSHAGGQSVIFVDVELIDAEISTFVYKPRCLRCEAAMQGILEQLNRDGIFNFATYRVLCKEHYGYEAMIPRGRNHVDSLTKAGRIYEELGGYLGLFHALGGSDLHFENLLVADGHAFICDSETILGMLLSGQKQPWDTIIDSVYRTGLLEWPHTPGGSDAMAEIRISGYAGGESFQLPFAQPRISNRLSFNLSVKHEVGIQANSDAGNRIYLDGQIVQPEEFKDWILSGFSKVHQWFQSKPSETISSIAQLFENTMLRFINRSTQIYVQMLFSAYHPKCLMEPLEVDLIFNTLKEYIRQWDRHGLMAECECSSLWQLDIPLFTVKAQSQELVHDYQTPLPLALEVTPLEYVAERIRHLSPEDRQQQVQYITTSLSSGEVHSPSFVASAVDYARQIGWRLCQLLRPPSEEAPWKSYQISSAGIDEVDILTDLYNGSAGIALFLAYLDALTPQQEFRHAAERALAYAIAHQDRAAIGAFQGLSGLIYVLTHLYHLWKQPLLLDQAVELSRMLVSQIENDDEFDVLNGAAGVIPVMLGLADATSGEGLTCAHRCAHHLLHHAKQEASGLSWPDKRPEDVIGNLTGFSHGAGGIGWALISLGCATDRLDYIEAGRQTFAYEALHFDKREKDWYDLRKNSVAPVRNGRHFANAWCNGAAGIGLSRIACWAMLGKNDDDLLKDAYFALSATLRNFHKIGNDTLCHGKSGNAELFLRFARLKNEPAFQIEANVQAQAQWQNFEKADNWSLAGAGFKVFPGLMLGLAGFGLHFLRLAYPEQVPSPLLLDAPPTLKSEKALA